MFCYCSNANQVPINTKTLKVGLLFVCDGLDLFSWISQSREAEGREIDDWWGFCTRVYGLSLDLHMEILVNKFMGNGAYISRQKGRNYRKKEKKCNKIVSSFVKYTPLLEEEVNSLPRLFFQLELFLLLEFVGANCSATNFHCCVITTSIHKPNTNEKSQNYIEIMKV